MFPVSHHRYVYHKKHCVCDFMMFCLVVEELSIVEHCVHLITIIELNAKVLIFILRSCCPVF